jgi:glycosyltransferase involved in cell wall biosynthesis
MEIKITHYVRRSRPSDFSIERVFEAVRSELSVRCDVSIWICKEYSNGLLPRLRDMWRARTYQGDVNHVTGDVHYLTFLLRWNRTVLTVHDLGVLDRLSGVSRKLVWLFWFWLPVFCSRIVVTVSETTRQNLISSVGCSPEKVRVIYNSVSGAFKPSPKPAIPNIPRILQIGTGENKNLLRVIESLDGIPCVLVIIGFLDEGKLDRLRHHGVAHENYTNLSASEIISEYVKSDVVVFASTSEGFGLPIIEAQAIGRPVITSDVMPMPEVANGAACFVDPFSVSSIRNGLLRVINDQEFRDKLVVDGFRNVGRFQLSEISRQYEEIYNEIVGGRD